MVRYRTVGDMTCTGAVESTASTVEEVIEEIRGGSRITERGQTRTTSGAATAMEDRAGRATSDGGPGTDSEQPDGCFDRRPDEQIILRSATAGSVWDDGKSTLIGLGSSSYDSKADLR